MRKALALASVLAALVGVITVAPAAAAHPAGGWVGSWAASPQRPSQSFEPNWSQQGFQDNTLRQVVRLSEGGSRARVTLSNDYGDQPLRIAGATIARSGDGAAVQPGSVRPLTFGGEQDVEIPAGAQASSDAIGLRTAPLERLTVTLYLAQPT